MVLIGSDTIVTDTRASGCDCACARTGREIHDVGGADMLEDPFK